MTTIVLTGEASRLWAEALASFGTRAHELSFLRSRATVGGATVTRAVTVGGQVHTSMDERGSIRRPEIAERRRSSLERHSPPPQSTAAEL